MVQIKKLKDAQKKAKASNSDDRPQRKEVETQKNTGYASKSSDTRGVLEVLGIPSAGEILEGFLVTIITQTELRKHR